MIKFISHVLSSKRKRIEALEATVAELEERLFNLEGAATLWDNRITGQLDQSRQQVQNAIVRAFSSKQMMDWLKNARLTAYAPDLTSLVQLAYPALHALTPGPILPARQELAE
jgi:hypothetical protein